MRAVVLECDSAEVFRAGLLNKRQPPKQGQNKRSLKPAHVCTLHK